MDRDLYLSIQSDGRTPTIARWTVWAFPNDPKSGFNLSEGEWGRVITMLDETTSWARNRRAHSRKTINIKNIVQEMIVDAEKTNGTI